MNRRRLAILALVSTLVATSCGGSSSPRSAPSVDTLVPGDRTTTTMFGMGDGGAAAPGDCPSRMPGEALTAEEAVVLFNIERICPAYVTIELGTPVTWTNDGAIAADVRVTEYQTSTPGAPPTTIVEHRVDPGDSWVWTPDTAGMLGFRISTVDAFVGTIEIQIPGQGSSHVH